MRLLQGVWAQAQAPSIAHSWLHFESSWAESFHFAFAMVGVGQVEVI